MSDGARAGILARLRASAVHAPAGPGAGSLSSEFLSKKYSPSERVPRLRRCMEAVRTEFLESTEDKWPDALRAFFVAEGIHRVAFGPATEAGTRLASAFSAAGSSPELVPYEKPVEEWKADLFDGIDAGFTATRGAIAETGTLVLWPSPEEPRLLSLVPPMHVALLRVGTIRDSFAETLKEEGWARGMPANALLISGPSKTADIEQTLAYGVHGPKRLVVVLV